MQPVEASQRCVVLAASGGRVGIPECQKYLDEGKHRRLYRFSPDDYEEAAGIWSNDEVALPGDPPGNLEVVDGLLFGVENLDAG